MLRLSAAVTCCLLASCGGSSAQPDFSLSTQPATLAIAQGGSESAQISVSGVDGFSGSVQVTAAPPSGISVSPSSFSLAIGAPQRLTISAAVSASPGTVTVSFTGNSGPLTHTATIQAQIEATVTSPYPPFRTRYLRTDSQYSFSGLQFFPPHFTAYDSVHNRFFVSNTTLNRIDVFDEQSESEIGEVFIQMPWGIDVSPDGTEMYVATAIGDIYLVDPGSLTVLQHYPFSTIGPQGYAAIEPFILASGQLALLGGIAALNVDGSQTFAIWNPVTNSLQVINAQSTFNFAITNIGQMTLTADRSQVIVGNADGGQIVVYNPSNGSYLTADGNGEILHNILPTPDGTRIFLNFGSEFDVLNANTLAQLGSFVPYGIYPSTSAVLSYDGSTVFSTDLLGDVSAYNTTSLTQTGWVPNFNVNDSQEAIVLSVCDPTGLAVGPIGHGVEFLDTTQVESGNEQTIFAIGFLSPGTGALDGGTSVQAQVSEENASSAENITSGTIYIGNTAALNVSLSNKLATGVTPPASAGGAADFTVVLPDGSVQLNPENFSYGPTIVELSTNAASADGGSQGVIFGYGLGQQPSNVTISVGGQAATVTQVIPSASPFQPYPFPMEAVLFTIPAGTAGTQATVSATTAAGSGSSPTPLTYVPAVQTFQSPSGALMQGLYDSTRGVVYFTDQSQIDVFSISSGNWLPPITISYTNSNSRLTGVALSTDGNTLAVADTGTGDIYVLNPSSPTNVKSFNVQTSGNIVPYGVVVTSAGIVYYIAEGTVSPPGAFYELDTNTGQITHYAIAGGSQFDRVTMNQDATLVFGSGPFVFNTATAAITQNNYFENEGDGNVDLALSGDGTTFLTEDMFTDTNLNLEGDITYVDRDVWLASAVYGQKMNSDGSLVFQPLTNGIDVHDAATGLLLYRVALPIQLANAYDALAIDDNDGLLFAITVNGMAEINLSSLTTPASLRSRALRAKPLPATGAQVQNRRRHKGHLNLPHLRYPASLR